MRLVTIPARSKMALAVSFMDGQERANAGGGIKYPGATSVYLALFSERFSSVEAEACPAYAFTDNEDESLEDIRRQLAGILVHNHWDYGRPSLPRNSFATVILAYGISTIQSPSTLAPAFPS
jgi:hypothetical protein